MAAMWACGRAAEQIPFLILEGRIDAILVSIDSDHREAFEADNPALRNRQAAS